MAIAERRLAAEFNRPGHDDRRPLDLRHLLRRRPPGGDRVRGRQPRRAPAARQARDALRRQPDPARRADGDGVLRGRPRPLPGLRLADPAGEGRHRRRRDRGRDPPRPLRRPALDHRRAHGHRLRLAEQGRQPEGARRAARPRRGPPHEGGLRLGPGQDVLRPGCRRRPLLAGDPLRRGADRPLERRLRALPGRLPGRGRASSSGGSTATCAAGWDAALPRWEAGAEVATRNASADTINALAAGVPGALRRLRRPLGEQPHRRQGRRRLQRRRAPGATSASASASTAWAGSPTGSPTTAASGRTSRPS